MSSLPSPAGSSLDPNESLYSETSQPEKPLIRPIIVKRNVHKSEKNVIARFTRRIHFTGFQALLCKIEGKSKVDEISEDDIAVLFKAYQIAVEDLEIKISRYGSYYATVWTRTPTADIKFILREMNRSFVGSYRRYTIAYLTEPRKLNQICVFFRFRVCNVHTKMEKWSLFIDPALNISPRLLYA